MKKPLEPYRYFFPLGALLGIWGVLRWIPYGFKFSETYPGFEHASTMVGGFLLSFAAGFLMTAVPKFTSSYPAKWAEIIPLWISISLLPFVEEVFSQGTAYSIILMVLIQILLFVAKRYKSKTGKPPESFLLIGVGLASAVIGLIILIQESFSPHSAQLMTLGRNLFYHSFFLILILGIGSRLIPAFTGWGPQLSFFERFKNQNQSLRIFFLGIGILIMASYLFEYFGFELSRFLRPLALTFVGLSLWKIYKFPQNRTRLSWGLWASAWSLLVGVWGGALMPHMLIHWHHISLISGFGLLTIMISTRVIIAHGGHNLMFESKSQSYFWIMGLFILGAVTRLTAGLIPSTYHSHLAYAAISWVIGIGIWTYSFGLKIKWKEDTGIKGGC